MNKDAENLIDALKEAFTYDDEDNELGKEYHAERGKVYEVDAQGYLGNLIYERKEETYGHYIDRHAAGWKPEEGTIFSNSITPEQAEALRKLADEYDTANATEGKGLLDNDSPDWTEPRYLSGLQIVEIDDNPDHFSIEAIDFDGNHDFALLSSLCEKSGISEAVYRSDEDATGDISGYDGTRKSYRLFSYTFHVAR